MAVIGNANVASQPTETGVTSAPAHPTDWPAVVTLAVATLIVASESSMAAFALPLISADLGVGASATAWVLLAYALPLAALAIPAGRWADRADVRLVFVFSLVGLGLASVLAALAPVFWVLMVGRVLQGCAAAHYSAIYLPLVTATVHEDQRGRAMSYISTIMLVGSMAIAPLGGFVAGAFGWREVFLIKAPLLLLVLWLGTRTLPARTGDGATPRLPLPDRSLLREALLIGGAITAGLLAFEQVEGQWPAAAGLAVTAVALTAWWARLPASRPVMSLLRQRRFGLPVLALMLVASSIGLIVFALPFYIADVLRQSPDLLGVALLFFIGPASRVSPIAGILADRVGPLPVAVVGSALAVAGMLTKLTLGAEASLTDLGWRMAAFGVGSALFSSPTVTAILDATPEGQAGTAGGISSVARTLASTVGPAVAALAWNLGGGGVTGFRLTVLVLAALALVGCFTLLAARSRTS